MQSQIRASLNLPGSEMVLIFLVVRSNLNLFKKVLNWQDYLLADLDSRLAEGRFHQRTEIDNSLVNGCVDHCET